MASASSATLGAVSFRQFVWLWNRVQGQTTPALHLEIAAWFDARWRAGDRQLLLLCFRGAGKSTLVAIFCAWLLRLQPNLRILVLSAEHELARKMVRNAKHIVERHPLTKGLLPDRSELWSADQLTVARPLALRDPSLLARGIGANITGARADVIICDDVEVPNSSRTAPRREDLRERLRELSYILVPGGLQLYVGTPHSHESIYAEERAAQSDLASPFLAGFRRLTIPVLDDAGRSRWPDRFTDAAIAAVRQQSGPTKFASQMLLAPRQNQDVRLDPGRLGRYDLELSYREGNRQGVLTLGPRRLVSANCWWDPAFGAPTTGDASVVAAVFTDEQGEYWLHRIAYLQHDPKQSHEVDEATQLCRQVTMFIRDLVLPAITIETNGLGRFLPALLRRELGRQGIGCSVLEHVSHSNKDQRILDAFDPILAAAALHVHASVWQTPFIREMQEWRPGRRCRDDGLDAVSGCLLAEPVRLHRFPTGPRPSWRPAATHLATEVDFNC